MLRYYFTNSDGIVEQYPLVGCTDFHIKHCLDGNDEMSFIVPTNSPDYPRLSEETQVDYDGNEWLIKKIDDDKFDLSLNFDFLKTRAYLNYKSETKPLAYVLEQHLPDGWTVIGGNISSISRTIEFDVCTDYDIIYECMDTYKVYFVWKILEKRLYVYSQETTVFGNGGISSDYKIRVYAYGKDGLTLENATVNGKKYGLKYVDSTSGSNVISITWRDATITNANTLYQMAVGKASVLQMELKNQSACGEYLTKDLNLKSVVFKGDSTEFATRIYAYGKDGLTLEEAIVNGERYGKQYIDNNQYASKLVCVVWKDERYTTASGLYEAALKKLNGYSFPMRSYECEVIDLAKQNSAFEFLKFKMHYKAILIDSERHTRVEHKVVEYDEYPNEPSRNVVTLSCTAGTIQSYIKDVTTGSQEEVKQIDSTLNSKIMMATALLLGAFGGHAFNGDDYGMPGNFFIADSENLMDAHVVWRYNVNGIGKSSTGVYGPYTTSITVNDEITTSIINSMIIRGEYIEASSIKATQIDQDYTDGVLKSAFKASEGLVESSFKDLKDVFTNEDGTGQLDILKEQYTKIKETVDSWDASFTEQYKGGSNHILNSSGLNDLIHWTETHSSMPVSTEANSYTNGNTISGKAFRFPSTTATIMQNVDDLLIGEKYTFSCKYKTDSDRAFKIEIGYLSENGEYIAQKVILDNSKVSSSVDWSNFEYTTEPLERASIAIKVYGSAYFLLSDMMLNEGSVAKTWSPAPNEIYTANTKVDKNGVTVSNTETSQKTCVTYNEFAGYYNDEKVFSVNKDETFMHRTFIDGELLIGSRNGNEGTEEGIMIIPYAESDGSINGVNIVILD